MVPQASVETLARLFPNTKLSVLQLVLQRCGQDLLKAIDYFANKSFGVDSTLSQRTTDQTLVWHIFITKQTNIWTQFIEMRKTYYFYFNRTDRQKSQVQKFHTSLRAQTHWGIIFTMAIISWIWIWYRKTQLWLKKLFFQVYHSPSQLFTRKITYPWAIRIITTLLPEIGETVKLLF